MGWPQKQIRITVKQDNGYLAMVQGVTAEPKSYRVCEERLYCASAGGRTAALSTKSR